MRRERWVEIRAEPPERSIYSTPIRKERRMKMSADPVATAQRARSCTDLEQVLRVRSELVDEFDEQVLGTRVFAEEANEEGLPGGGESGEDGERGG